MQPKKRTAMIPSVSTIPPMKLPRSKPEILANPGEAMELVTTAVAGDAEAVVAAVGFTGTIVVAAEEEVLAVVFTVAAEVDGANVDWLVLLTAEVGTTVVVVVLSLVAGSVTLGFVTLLPTVDATGAVVVGAFVSGAEVSLRTPQETVSRRRSAAPRPFPPGSLIAVPVMTGVPSESLKRPLS